MNAPWREKPSDYFNYGYTEAEWVKHSEKVKSKFDIMNEMVKKGTYILPQVKDELNYLMCFPSDYGGLGDIYDQEYENVNFYDMKTNLQKLVPMNRSDMLYVPLDIPGSNLNNFNGIIPNTNLDPLNNNTITPSPVTLNNFVYPQQNYPYLYNPQYRQFFYNQNYYMNMIKMQQMTQMK